MNLPKLLLLLMLAALPLTGCSDSSSSTSSSPGDFPYGATSQIVSFDYDNDGNPDDSITTDYSYNDRMQVTSIEETRNVYSYDDTLEQNILTSQYLSQQTINPDITDSTSLLIYNAVGSMRTTVMGVITEIHEQDYHLDDATGELAVNPSYEGTISLTYASNGNLLKQYEISFDDDDQDGIFDATATWDHSSSYNDAGQLTSDILLRTADNDNDGNNDYRYERAYRFSYDSYGNQTIYAYQNNTDSNGDGLSDTSYGESKSYSHTYNAQGQRTNTLVVLAAGTEDEEQYTISYSYNNAGWVVYAGQRRDRYGNDGIEDTVERHSYSYNSAGLITGDDEAIASDTDADGQMDSLTELTHIWTYNEAGLLTSYSKETSMHPMEGPLTSHLLETHTYSYTETGELSLALDENWTDTNLDGQFNIRTLLSEKSIQYNEEGFLTQRRNTEISYDTDSGEETYSSIDSLSYTYTDGMISSENTRHEENGQEQDNRTTSFNYDASGRFIGATGDENNNLVVSYSSGDLVTIQPVSESSSETTLDIDFSQEGLPTGSAAWSIDSETIAYPALPEHFAPDTESPTSKVHLMQIAIPKIMEFYLKLQGRRL